MVTYSELFQLLIVLISFATLIITVVKKVTATGLNVRLLL